MTGEPPVATGHHFLPLLGTKAKVKYYVCEQKVILTPPSPCQITLTSFTPNKPIKSDCGTQKEQEE